MSPKYEKNNKVIILGSEELVWEITDYKSDDEYNYIYKLNILEGYFPQDELPWIPECLLCLKN